MYCMGALYNMVVVHLECEGIACMIEIQFVLLGTSYNWRYISYDSSTSHMSGTVCTVEIHLATVEWCSLF